MASKVKGWSKLFPKKKGKYWFYGYRYGKASCGQERKPELMLVDVRKASTGFMYVANGHFMYPSEVECAHFKKADLPEVPKI